MDWKDVALILLGSGVGGFIGVRVAVAVLQTKVAKIEEEIRLLRQAKHEHAGMLSEHEMRLEALERRD